MSDKVRIYQLAKELGVENKVLMAKLDEMGVEYKSHSSTLEHDTAETVKQLLAGGTSAKPTATEISKGEEEKGSRGEKAAKVEETRTATPVVKAKPEVSKMQPAPPQPMTQTIEKPAAQPVQTQPVQTQTVQTQPAQAKPAQQPQSRPAATAVAIKPAEPEVKKPLTKEERRALIPADAPRRAPVVTVMGHVDHGKTSLLDFIRKSRVAEREAGGITQHIGAYQVQTSHGPITFFDTPGHEAFTTIRQRGANATDIAVIVVAADDSIMPQTREAIAHAKAAKVPIIVAVNKTDLPQANPDKVKQDLMQLELIPEEYGGDTVVVPLSAKTGAGVDNLLEMISLIADLENYRAVTTISARGVIIESVLDKRAGVLATVLVQEGTLKVTDYVVAGEAWAKVKAMTDSDGKRVTEAKPSVPVQILGFSEQPVAGESIEAVSSEVAAKALVAERKGVRVDLETEDRNSRAKVTLAELFGTESKDKVINLIVRADTQGSLEAIKGILQKEAAKSSEVDISVMLAEVGAPNESDLLLASTSGATIMTFNVNPTGTVEKSAERQGITIKPYKIIYQLAEDVQRMIRGQTEPTYEEKILGHAEVRQLISIPKMGTIAGSYVTDGVVRRGAKARIYRGGKEVYKGSISQLKRFKDDAREVGTGFECGINLQNYDTVQQGDVIEVYDMVEVPA
jgi:translation initiation factor IF-2